MSIRENLSVVAGDLVAMLRTRIELFSAEFAEQKHRAFILLVLLLSAVLLLFLAVVLGSFLLVTLFWSTDYRYWAIGGLAIAYAVTGLCLVWVVWHRLRTQAPPFSATLEELQRDIVVLGSLRESFTQGVRDEPSGDHRE
jgi:uncharacterized membrane protein YqjE